VWLRGTHLCNGKKVIDQLEKMGFENVGCTLRDFQNYYRDLRTKIKDADT
jgi:hypothetical protein